MKQEQKELLLKDLCSRLPFGQYSLPIESIKLYLYPLSSMDKKQTHKFLSTCNGYCEYNWTEETFDWLNAHHFDWRSLIPMGLALDATNLNIY